MGFRLKATIPNVVGNPTLTPITTTQTVQGCGIPYPPGTYYFSDYAYLQVGTNPVKADLQVHGFTGLPTPWARVDANLATYNKCVPATARTDLQGVAHLTFPTPDAQWGWYSPPELPKTWVLSARVALLGLEVARLGDSTMPLPRFTIY